MIIKYSFKRDDVGNNLYKYVDCKLLKCDIINVAYFKEYSKGEKYTAIDIESGLLITRESTIKALIHKVNNYKEKIEIVRNSDNYKKLIELNKKAVAVNNNEKGVLKNG